MNDGTNSVVFLYEPAQDLVGCVPVPSPTRGRDKGGVSALVGSGTVAFAATIAKCASALSTCPSWRYTLPSAERSSPLELLVVAVVDCLCCWATRGSSSAVAAE